MERSGVWMAAQAARLRRGADQVGLAVAGSDFVRPWASPAVSAIAVAVATMPFAGWKPPAMWLAVMLALIAGRSAWAASQTDRNASEPVRLNPFGWLISAGFAAAAFYLVFFFTGAAQTLGVTLYGVMMFQILARDYATPRRLIVNLLAHDRVDAASSKRPPGRCSFGARPWRGRSSPCSRAPTWSSAPSAPSRRTST